MRSGCERPPPSAGSAAEEVELAELETVVAQDSVRHRQVEVEVRQRELEQVVLAVELQRANRRLDLDGASLGAGELLAPESADVVDRTLDARLQLGEALFRVVPLRDLDAGEAGRRRLHEVARDLHLAREREHVGVEARL